GRHERTPSGRRARSRRARAGDGALPAHGARRAATYLARPAVPRGRSPARPLGARAAAQRPPLVVMITTPLEPASPYARLAVAPLSTSILSIFAVSRSGTASGKLDLSPRGRIRPPSP